MYLKHPDYIKELIIKDFDMTDLVKSNLKENMF